MRNLILSCHLSPGDIVMLTAAVRDLHRSYPKQFLTAIDTTAFQLWKHNPFLSDLETVGEGAVKIDCHYPLIDHSNQRPFHFIHGYSQFLSDQLGVSIIPTEFRGDIYISDEEKGWISQVEELTGNNKPFWIVAAGGKLDFTIKWWSHQRFQEVIDYFEERIQFVQIGETAHHHPALNGVIDLRGKTDIRQLIRLVSHSQGVLCPVTFAMHLAAAVPTKPGAPKSRACVVVAGGREPVHWEAYPGHRFLHTQGALPCCETGGCWKSRTVPIGDGDQNDRRENLCVQVVSNGLPKCMDMISTCDVIRALESYFEGGMIKYLERTSPIPDKRETREFTEKEGQVGLESEMFEVCGLRRSGLHAIMNWILNHYEGNICFINDFNHRRKGLDEIERSDRMPCIDEKLRFPVSPCSEAEKRILLIGYEDAHLKGIPNQKFPESIMGRFRRRRRILVLRDPFNLFASRLRAAQDRVETGFGTSLMKAGPDGKPVFPVLWKRYAHEYLGNTNELGNDTIKISFNRWGQDAKYRSQISDQLGVRFCDAARETVPNHGYGSSFDHNKYNQNGSNMAVQERWRRFANDSAYLSLFDDPEIWDLSEKIFGDIGIDKSNFMKMNDSTQSL